MKILLIGASGRLGKAILEIAAKSKQIEAIYQVGSPSSGLPSAIDPFLDLCDVVLDVSTPIALETNLKKIVVAKRPLVIGSTGHSMTQIKAIEDASLAIPVFMTANFAPGISYLKELLKHLPSIGSYHIEDKHHMHKKDAPSGTAKEIAKLLPLEPTITSIREGDTLGSHTITLSLPFETIEIRHTVTSRDVFAYGALTACEFLVKQKPGFYKNIRLKSPLCYSHSHD